MTRDLLLRHKNTHLKLRDRIRVALESQRKTIARTASLSSATPEQLKEISQALCTLQHLVGNRVTYSEHVARLGSAKPMHYNSLSSLGNQIADAEKRLAEAEEAIFGTVQADPVADSEIDAIEQTYIAENEQSRD